MANVAIDYTSRDFQSIKSDVIKIVKNRLAQSTEGKVWDDSDPADFGVALVEAFAYVGDITNYYIDRVVNEAYLPTAVQRGSILKLASALNYIPSGFTRSTVILTASNPTNNPLIIPEGAQFSVTVAVPGGKSTVKLLFSAAESVEVPAKESGTAGTADITVWCGEDVSLRAVNRAQNENEIDGEYLTTSSTGYANQSYTLKGTNPVTGSIQLYVEDNQEYVLWSRVTHLYDYGPNSTVYSTVVNADNSITVVFGDGVSGAIPPQSAEIRVQYAVLAEGGLIGNVPAGLKDWKITAIPSNLTVTLADLASLSFTNDEAGYGGSNPESNDSIRLNAPRALTTLNRAITLEDFGNLALSYPGVGQRKAAAYAETPKSVVVYVGPDKDVSEQAWYPGYNNDNTEARDSLINLTDDVATYLTARSQIGTSVTVLPPEYVDVNIALLYEKPLELTDAQVQASIKSVLFDKYGYDAMLFDTAIWPSKIEADLKANSLASRVQVQFLCRDSVENRETPVRETLIPAQGELFTFSDIIRDTGTGFSAYQIHPFASLSDLAFSAGKVNRAFSPSTYNYSVKLPHATTSLTLTPTKLIDADSVTYKLNGKDHVGGVFTGIPVKTKQTISVIVTSADQSNTTTYTVSVVRAA